MADKELRVKVTTEADISGLEDIEQAISNLEDKTITVRPEIESMELEEVENRIEELEDKRAEIYMGVDDTPLEEVEAELEELEARQIELTIEADSSSVDDASGKIEELDGKDVNISVNADTSGTEDSINSLEEALTAVSAGAALAGMEQMVSTAGNIQDSWNRLGLTFGEVTGQMKTDISEAGAATGRSGGLIRQYFNDMGVAGVTNTELLQQSFEALSGRAYQTGNSIESMEQKMKMMVMSGNAGARQLTQLGISTADLGRVMGVSADEASKMFKTLSQEERLRVLTQAMGDGKKANEQYKNSWQGLKDQVDKATSALMGAVGDMILPFLVPAMQVATQVIEALSAGFKALPAPIRSIIGGVGALVMGFLALTTVIRIATAVQAALNLTMLANPYVLVAAAILALVAALVYCYNTNEEFRNSVNQLFNDLQRLANGDWHVVVEYEQKGVDMVVDTAGMLASNDLSQGLSRMLMGDEAVNQANANLDGFLENIKSKLHEGMDAFWNDGTQGLLGWLAELAGIDVGSYLQNFTMGFNSIGASITGVIMGIQGFIMNVLQIPVFIQQAVQQGVANFQSFSGQVSGVLSGIIGFVVGWFGNFVGQFSSGASRAVSAFASNFTGIAEAVAGELGAMVSTAQSYCQQLLDTLRNAAAEAVNLWKTITGEKSPGYIYEAFKGELDAMVGVASDFKVPTIMGDNAQSMVNNWGSPSLGFNTGSNGGTQAVGGVTMNITINGDVDSDERMEKFADYIITRMNWDNTTAGRTV